MTVSVKLTRQGNSTGLRLPRDVLQSAGLDRGDEVTLEISDGRIVIAKADAPYAEAMKAYAECRARYGRALDELAK
jgi:putative addiction module antidote